ncbi:MAG TPA: hypothetical protein VEV41_01405 [Terriglobales bacterium]|jgi:hypothetical protein|nr:hypothetical protein [Terriglobales bacterium]
MKQHPYLRAYLAGIAVPTCFMLVVLTVFVIARFVYNVPVPIERVIVFPLALVPNAFGLWNILFTALHRHRYLPLGLHGALLPLILAPAGLILGTSLGVLARTEQGLVWFGAVQVHYLHFAIIFPAVLVVYYLVWKYLVGFLNGMLGIAA